MIAASGVSIPQNASAEEMNAGVVLEKMTVSERVSHIAGVIEGLAYARWLKDKPDAAGSQCIYDWYYDGGEVVARKIHTWFEHHADKPVGALLYVLIKQECGE